MRQLPRFVVAGALNTLITYLLYLALLPFVPYLWSYVATYLVGIVIGYLINATWVFRRAPALGTAAAYPLVYGVNLALGAVLLTGLVELLNVPKEWAPIIVIGITVPLMFFLTRALFERGRPS